MIFNPFRLAGDFVHLASVTLLLYKIQSSRSCSGISAKTQQLYCLVYTCRYVDLLWNFMSLYNTVLKILFLVFSYATLYLIVVRYQTSYRQHAAHDSFRIWFLIIPALLISLILNFNNLSPFEVSWTFSIYLEAVAIIPQLFLLRRCNKIDIMTADYVFLLGLYRFLYILNWIARYWSEYMYSNWVAWTAGIIQTIIYVDFFYYYGQSRLYGKELDLPK